MKKRTKIIATIGPASWDPNTLKKLHKAGLNVARLNASFADIEEIKRILDTVRDVSPEIAAVLDLKGHKIRLNDFGSKPIVLKNGEEVILGTENDTKSKHGFIVSYKELSDDIKVGARILIDDGKVELKVTKIKGNDIYTKVIQGGEVKRLKTVSTPGTDLTFPPLTKKDKADLKYGVELGYDFVAASFVRNKEDILAVQKYTKGSKTQIIAKIEDAQGVRNFDEILEVVDAVMIARGDMGVELPLEKVPAIQRELINKCRAVAKPVIVATHMLESMIENTFPTRAEVNDVATAVFQGADAVMLSGETSTGQHPKEAVATMSKILKESEKDVTSIKLTPDATELPYKTPEIATEITEAALHAAIGPGIKKILVLTKSGITARLLSRHRLNKQIYALTDNENTARQINLSYGMRASTYDKFAGDRDEVIEGSIARAKELGYIKKGEIVMLVSGSSVTQTPHDGGFIEIKKV